MIGANTAVAETMSIPDGSLGIGSPGTAAQPLDEKVKALLAKGAQHHVHCNHQYNHELKLID